MNLRELIGSGDKIMGLTLPVLVVGVILNFLFPSVFGVGGPPAWLAAVSVIALIAGLILWLWAVALIVTRASKGQLITTGPFALVRHPIYTAVSLLVLPAIGFLLDSWLGLAIGVVMYAASRRYAPEEERKLAETFGAEWETYSGGVLLPWV